MKTPTTVFRAYCKARGIPETDSHFRLAGIEELREVVAWANGQPEYTHDFMTPIEIIERYRKES